MGKAKPVKTKRRLVNKDQAAAHCKVSAATLTNYKSRFPELPVEKMGSGREGWVIDLDKLDAWRAKTGLLNWNPATTSTDGMILRNQRPPDPRHELQAEMIRMQLAERRGLLVERADVVKLISTKFAEFAKNLDRLPMLLAAQLKWKPAEIEAFRSCLDTAREALVRGDDGFFTRIPKK